MRQAFLVLLSSLALSLSAFAGQMESYEFMDGLYSFQAPKGWHVEADEDDLTMLVLKPAEDSPSMILIATPNPHMTDELAAYVGLQVGAMLGLFGNGEINDVDEDITVAEQYDGVAASFTMDIGGEPGSGLAVAFDAHGYAVAVAIAAPDSDREFLDYIEPILNSFEIDEDMLEEHEDELDEIGVKTLRELNRLIEDAK